ncbi:MAG: SinI family restriction endonuclease [Chitinophagaceae bacterium]|jgi:hypothetical protein|nr:SinI family restriction endonuclease [Chitinophagaceae bacterium]
MIFLLYGNGFTREQIVSKLKQFAGNDYTDDMFLVLTTGLKNPELLLKLKTRGTEITDPDLYVQKWVEKYLKGYNNRPSKRIGNPSNTVPDSLIAFIFEVINPSLKDENLELAKYSHSIMMTIENLVGEMLEEFLSEILKPYGWYCCWGTTIKSVDFCHLNGALLQIKTSDNSENSSSSAIRLGTPILKWARRKSTQLGQYYWEDLVKMTGAENLTEANFREFVKNVLTNNPKCIYNSFS